MSSRFHFRRKGGQQAKNPVRSRSNSIRKISPVPSSSSSFSDLSTAVDMQIGRTAAEVLSGAAFNAMHIAADIGGVPGLFVAVTLVEQIAELCMNVRRNRNEAKQLCLDCKDLYDVIQGACKGKRKPPFIEKMVEEFIGLLQEIQAEMLQWSKLNYWKAFVNQVAVAESIALHGKRLDRMTKKFQIGALAHLATEPGRYEESRRKDRAEAMHEFARPGFANELKRLASDAKVKGEADDVRQAMGQVIQELGLDDTLNDADRQQLHKNLFIVSDAIGQLPTSLHIPSDLLQFDPTQPVAGSSIYDIYCGTYLTQTVAIKKARAFACVRGSVEHIIKEARNWRSACEVDPKEEFILQLIGVSFFDESFIMVSRWMKNRDLLSFIREHGESVNRKHMVKRIAKGLQILHQHVPPIAHGHLKASNIMINDHGDPLLGDFGLSKSLKNISGQPMTEVKGVDSFRWFAPEMLDEETAIISTRSDIYSFSMTVLEVMTGEVPFKHIARATSVPIALLDGRRPEPPMDATIIARGLDAKLWKLLTHCWEQMPYNRPNIIQVMKELEAMWPELNVWAEFTSQ